MLSLQELLIRMFIALAVGGIMGIERESAGKEAGVRTSMLVASGAAVFSMISLSMPYIIASDNSQILNQLLASGNYIGIISNIVSGIGFLGAGIIIKTEQHVHGLTTAAMIWTSAGVGTLIGIGMIEFGIMVGITLPILLYLMRNFALIESIRPNWEETKK